MTITREFVHDPSLVLYLPLYKLDGKEIVSQDAYGHVATVTGALWEIGGRRFDGADDKISIPDHTVLDIGTGDFSIMVIGLSMVENGEVLQMFVEKRNNVAPYLGYAFYYGDSSDNMNVQINDTVNTSVASDTLGDMQDGVKRSYAVTVDRNSATGVLFYRDGVQWGAAKDGTASQGSIANTIPITIGLAFGDTFDLEGTMSEVFIYNRALSPLEIQRNYLATKWRFQ